MQKLLKLINGFRYISLVAVFSCFLGSLAMFYVGARKTGVGIYYLIAESQAYVIADSHAGHAANTLSVHALATMQILQALDSFLFALVLLYSAYGIFMIFIVGQNREVDMPFPRGIVPQSLSDLKEKVIVVVVVILFIIFLEIAWSSLYNFENKTYELLIFPLSIALLALAIRLLNLGDATDKECQTDIANKKP